MARGAQSSSKAHLFDLLCAQIVVVGLVLGFGSARACQREEHKEGQRPHRRFIPPVGACKKHNDDSPLFDSSIWEGNRAE